MPNAQTILLTGASDGIGAAAARRLAAAGHRLLLVGRSPDKTAAVARATGGEALVADFARLDDVRALAQAVRARTDRIDVLANNAGAIFGPRELTSDGHERTLQVNYLAPFLLTRLLLPEMEAGAGVVVNVASSASWRLARFDIDDLESERRYSPNVAYGNAKLANILFTRALHERLGDRGISTVALDPGNVRTNFASGSSSWLRFVYRTPLARLVLISPEKGGDNLVHFIAGTPGADWERGAFYTETRPALARETNPLLHNEILIADLWSKTSRILGLDDGADAGQSQAR